MEKPKTPIRILPKKDLYPAFGMADLVANVVYIREDLVRSWAYKFVLCHELYHIKDGPGPWLWCEIKANVHAGIRHPIGFLIILFRSIFSLDRWKTYFRLFKKEFS